MVNNFVSWVKELSLSQFLTVLVILAIVILIIALAKKVVKWVIGIVFIIVVCIYFGVISPEQVKSSAELLKDKVTSVEVNKIVQVSDKVRVVSGKIEIQINEEWYNFDDISRVRVGDNGVYLIEVNNSEVEVDNPAVKSLLDVIENRN